MSLSAINHAQPGDRQPHPEGIATPPASRPPFLRQTLECLLAGIVAGLASTLALMAVVMLLSTLARAGETDATRLRVANPGDVGAGSLLLSDPDGDYRYSPTLHTDVRIQVSGMLARVSVRQRFHNPDSRWREGIYVFPLPETAAVDHLRMHIGGRIIEGEIRERQAARKRYRRARAAGQRASLVEQERANIFTTSVANIGPGADIGVEIQYQQDIRYDQGSFRLRFPMVVAPRYLPGNTHVTGFSGTGWGINTDQVPDAERITPPVQTPTVAAANPGFNPVTLQVDLDAGLPLAGIDSPYHAIQREQVSDSHSLIRLTGPVPADRDFELVWRAQPGQAPRAALFHQRQGQYDYALLMLMPPAAPTALHLPREMIFVIDTSGSMAGPSIRQARQALLRGLQRLQPGDSFNIIRFSDHATKLYPQARATTAEQLDHARNWIRGLHAGGGTEMAPALRAALHTEGEDQRLRQVVFITDGSVGNEDALFTLIQRHLGHSRLFTVGIGAAPNSHFMRRAARFGRGTHTTIGNQSEVAAKMQALFAKLEHPLLADIHIEGLPPAVQQWPAAIPDLYLGEPLLLALRAQHLPAQLRLSGRFGSQPWQASLQLQGGVESPAVAVLWARRRIDGLMDRYRIAGPSDDLRQAITATALEHHLVSRFTSLVAVDKTPVRPAEQALDSHALVTRLPAGWHYDRVFGRMPQTATPANLYLLLGTLMLLAGALLRWRLPA